MASSAEDRSHFPQLRLLLEELCTELCRFAHVAENGLRPENIRIEREYFLGSPGTFADIHVDALGIPPYVVEVKFGYSSDTLLRHMRRKYAEVGPSLANVTKVILVVDASAHASWP